MRVRATHMRHGAARRAAAVAAACCTIAGGAEAQTGAAPRDALRDTVAGARLGAGYAQMINLSAAPDISAANYRIGPDQPGGSTGRMDVFRLPLQRRWMALTPDTDLYWRAAGGYLQLRDELPLAAPQSGVIRSRWQAYSASAGVLASVRMGLGFALEPALDVGLARLDNHASFDGDAQPLRPLLDGLLFNWHTDAYLVTPSLGLQWSALAAGGRTSVHARLAHTWITSFGETDPVQSFRETASLYSLRGEFVRSTGLHLAGRPLDWLAFGGVAGFFGANRHALGFDTVAELGGGFEVPLSLSPGQPARARVSGSYLRGDNVRGWSIGISLPF